MMLLKFLLVLIVGNLFLLLFLYVAQRQLIYFPSRSAITPRQAGVPEMQVIELPTQDGLILKAWYRPPIQSHLPTVVHFHGNAGDIGNRAIIVKPFLDEGFGVLLLTYRGYSDNPGKPSEEGLYNDARAALQFLKNSSIILYGDSIGSAVAVQMATEYSVKALVLQSPFTSLAALGSYHYPFLPIRWFLKDKYDSVSKASKIHIPVLILHGESDDIVPPQFGRQLFEAFAEPKQFSLIPSSGHNDLYQPDLIIHFIRQYCK